LILSIREAKNYVEKRKEESGNITYVYSKKHIENRNKKKMKRIKSLSKSLSKLRSQIRKDLQSGDLKTKYTALAVALIDETYERVGNSASARNLKHYGVTTWMKKHFTIRDGKATIKYVGKSGVKQKKTVSEKGTLKVLKELLKDKRPNDKVFKGDDYSINADNINAYLKKFKITAKDIRGLHANEEMRKALKQVRKGKLPPKGEKERDKKLKEEFKSALELAAAEVGHEPGTLKNQYLIPTLEPDYLKDGRIGTLASAIYPLSKRASFITEAKKEKHTGAMVALMLPDNILKRLTKAGLIDEESVSTDGLHLTLLYLGEAKDLNKITREAIKKAVEKVCSKHEPLKMSIAGSGFFHAGEDGFPIYLVPNAKGLSALQTELETVVSNLVDLPSQYGWVPHMTVGFSQDKPEFLDFKDKKYEWKADTVRIQMAGENFANIKIGKKPLSKRALAPSPNINAPGLKPIPQSPNVVIEPLDNLVQQAVVGVKTYDPALLNNVTKVVVHQGGGSGQLGHVEMGPGKDPREVHIFKDRIVNNVKQHLTGRAERDIQLAIIRAIMETIAHEGGHIGKTRTQEDILSNPHLGEGEAERQEQEFMSKLPKISSSCLYSKTAMNIDGFWVNTETGEVIDVPSGSSHYQELAKKLNEFLTPEQAKVMNENEFTFIEYNTTDPIKKKIEKEILDVWSRVSIMGNQYGIDLPDKTPFSIKAVQNALMSRNAPINGLAVIKTDDGTTEASIKDFLAIDKWEDLNYIGFFQKNVYGSLSKRSENYIQDKETAKYMALDHPFEFFQKNKDYEHPDFTEDALNSILNKYRRDQDIYMVFNTLKLHEKYPDFGKQYAKSIYPIDFFSNHLYNYYYDIGFNKAQELLNKNSREFFYFNLNKIYPNINTDKFSKIFTDDIIKRLANEETVEFSFKMTKLLITRIFSTHPNLREKFNSYLNKYEYVYDIYIDNTSYNTSKVSFRIKERFIDYENVEGNWIHIINTNRLTDEDLYNVKNNFKQILTKFSNLNEEICVSKNEDFLFQQSRKIFLGLVFSGPVVSFSESDNSSFVDKITGKRISNTGDSGSLRTEGWLNPSDPEVELIGVISNRKEFLAQAEELGLITINAKDRKSFLPSNYQYEEYEDEEYEDEYLVYYDKAEELGYKDASLSKRAEGIEDIMSVFSYQDNDFKWSIIRTEKTRTKEFVVANMAFKDETNSIRNVKVILSYANFSGIYHIAVSSDVFEIIEKLKKDFDMWRSNNKQDGHPVNTWHLRTEDRATVSDLINSIPLYVNAFISGDIENTKSNPFGTEEELGSLIPNYILNKLSFQRLSGNIWKNRYVAEVGNKSTGDKLTVHLMINENKEYAEFFGKVELYIVFNDKTNIYKFKLPEEKAQFNQAIVNIANLADKISSDVIKKPFESRLDQTTASLLQASTVLSDIRDKFLPNKPMTEPNLKFVANVLLNNEKEMLKEGITLLCSDKIVSAFNAIEEATIHNASLSNNTKSFIKTANKDFLKLDPNSREFAIELSKWQLQRHLNPTGKLDIPTIEALKKERKSTPLTVTPSDKPFATTMESYEPWHAEIGNNPMGIMSVPLPLGGGGR